MSDEKKNDTWTSFLSDYTPPATPTELIEQINTRVMCFGSALEDCRNEVNERITQSRLAANPTTRAEADHVKAGRQGEDMVRRRLEEELGAVEVSSGVRINAAHGRREIDLVLRTRTHVYLFEIKNWSGQVELTPEGKWKQVRQAHCNPREIIHGNALESMNEKEALFREQFKLDKNQVSSYVVFPKDNLKLTYAIGRDPRVMSSLEFDAWIKDSIFNF